MKTTAALMSIVLAAAAAGAMAADAPSKQTFEGQYQWKQGGKDSLSAEFTPAGEDQWKIKFRFEWNGNTHTWKGKAKGPLVDGSKLTGTVESDGGRRTWDFDASIDEGVLTGKHVETTGGRQYETGTFSMNR